MSAAEMPRSQRAESRKRDHACQCCVPAMGHHFGADLVCTNRGKWLGCKTSFEAHQTEQQPCAFVKYREEDTEEPTDAP